MDRFKPARPTAESTPAMLSDCTSPRSSSEARSLPLASATGMVWAVSPSSPASFSALAGVLSATMIFWPSAVRFLANAEPNVSQPDDCDVHGECSIFSAHAQERVP
jgi:hypothetical protein